MYEYVAFFILVFTSIIGMLYMLNLLYNKLINTRLEEKARIIALENQDADLIEYIVRSAAEQAHEPIAVIIDEKNQETIEILKRLKKEYRQLIILTHCKKSF